MYWILSMTDEMVNLQSAVLFYDLYRLRISVIRVDSRVRKILLCHLLKAFCKV